MLAAQAVKGSSICDVMFAVCLPCASTVGGGMKRGDEAFLDKLPPRGRLLRYASRIREKEGMSP